MAANVDQPANVFGWPRNFGIRLDTQSFHSMASRRKKRWHKAKKRDGTKAISNRPNNAMMRSCVRGVVDDVCDDDEEKERGIEKLEGEPL